MAKRLFHALDAQHTLYRDPKTGIAWVEDRAAGIGHSCHSNIDATGSVRGMKDLGYWGRKDRTRRSHGFIYNIDSLVVHDEYDEIALRHCQCGGYHGKPTSEARAAAGPLEGSGRQLRSYHFSLGDSTRGPVGYCARVFGRSKAEAAELLLRAVERAGEVELPVNDTVAGVEYVAVYFGPAVPVGGRCAALAMLQASIDEEDDTGLDADDEADALARIAEELIWGEATRRQEE